MGKTRVWSIICATRITRGRFESPDECTQLEAVESLDGPVLIVAGSGSGKTFCLVERTADLLASREIAPERVLVSTFTKKAAKELKTRMADPVLRAGGGLNPLDLTVGTLHSIFLVSI